MGENTTKYVTKSKPTKVRTSALQGNPPRVYLKAGHDTSPAHCG